MKSARPQDLLAAALIGALAASTALAQQFVGKFLATFKEFPPSQKAGSFSLDRVLESLQEASGSGS
jgi:hypothetical protein